MLFLFNQIRLNLFVTQRKTKWCPFPIIQLLECSHAGVGQHLFYFFNALLITIFAINCSHFCTFEIVDVKSKSVATCLTLKNCSCDTDLGHQSPCCNIIFLLTFINLLHLVYL